MKAGLTRFVGLQITRDRTARTITLTQEAYIERIFEQQLSVATHKDWKHETPCGTSKEEVAKFMAIRPTDNELIRTTNIKRGYLTIIGGVMYAMVFTRP